MKKHSKSIVFFVSLTSAVAFAQEMDIDQSDSLRFQDFHKNKKEAVKAWEKTDNAPTKAYQDQAGVKTTATSSTTSVPVNTAPAETATKAVAPATEASGKRFEIRERYTLSRSAKTPYSAFYVIEPLFKQSAQLCAKGWKKLAERSEPIEQDYYLYYEIECL